MVFPGTCVEWQTFVADVAPGRSISRSALQVVSGPVLWSPDEDKLLHAIVHEFGSNWSLVCDVLASSTALQGIARNWRQCKDRYKEIQVSGICAGCDMIQVRKQRRAEDLCWVRDVGWGQGCWQSQR